MPLGGTNLLFNEIEIVEQPFPGWRDLATLRNNRRQQVAHFDQCAFVRRQPTQQPVRRAPRRQPVRPGKRLAVLRHLIGAEQLRSQRGLIAGWSTWPAAASKQGFQLPKISAQSVASVQFRGAFRGWSTMVAVTGTGDPKSPESASTIVYTKFATPAGRFRSASHSRPPN
jgi:hypothetical protein